MNAVRKFHESYPGEAWDDQCHAHEMAIESAASDLAYTYAHDPARLATDADGNDINADTVVTLVGHILELRKLIAKDAQDEAIRAFELALSKDSFVQALAEGEVGELT